MDARESPSAVPGVVALLAVLAAFAVAIFAAPPLTEALRSLGVTLGFAKVFRYLLLALLMGVLCWALRPWRDVPADVYGLRGPNARPLLAVPGALVAITLLVALAGLDAAAGNLAWDPHGSAIAKHRLPQAIGRGLLLGLAEELFFRGWMFGRVRARRGDLRAAIFVAVVFGAIHAFRQSDAPKDLAASPSGALEVLAAWGRNLLDLREFGPSFLGLALLSLVLTAAVVRWKTLWFGIGLHAAAVAWLPLHSGMTQRRIDRDWLGSKWLYDGVPGWTLLALAAFLLWPRPALPDPPAPVSR